jgi:hypothetical protein
MYDYGARMYMPDIGRWNMIDQLVRAYTSEYSNPFTIMDGF